MLVGAWSGHCYSRRELLGHLHVKGATVEASNGCQHGYQHTEAVNSVNVVAFPRQSAWSSDVAFVMRRWHQWEGDSVGGFGCVNCPVICSCRGCFGLSTCPLDCAQVSRLALHCGGCVEAGDRCRCA